MNNAEKNFWGNAEAMAEYLRSVRRPGEPLKRYGNNPDVDEAIVYAKCLGEAGETLLAELMKMKAVNEAHTERHPITVIPKAAVA